jgi:hypothetical protein
MEMKIKWALRFCVTPVRMAINKQTIAGGEVQAVKVPA